MSGSSSERVAVVTAKGRTVPALMARRDLLDLFQAEQHLGQRLRTPPGTSTSSTQFREESSETDEILEESSTKGMCMYMAESIGKMRHVRHWGDAIPLCSQPTAISPLMLKMGIRHFCGVETAMLCLIWPEKH
jgi:hypothetical protein